MDDEIKFNGLAHAGCEDDPTGETGATAVGEAATDNDAAATEGDTSPGDTVGACVDGGETPPQGVANRGDSGDEPGDGPSVEALVTEAERRGYLRGRNERIERLMAQPGVWEEPKSGPTILNRPRRSIWD